MITDTTSLRWGERRKPPTDRRGVTRKMPFGKSAIYVTCNRWDDGDKGICELWAKADEGLQGEADELCETGSLALQYGCPAETLVRHWYGHGIRKINQPWSVRDALALALAAEAGIEVQRHVACEVVDAAGQARAVASRPEPACSPLPPCALCGRTQYPVEYGPRQNKLPAGSLVGFDNGGQVWICRRCSRDPAALDRLETDASLKANSPICVTTHSNTREAARRVAREVVQDKDAASGTMAQP